MTVRPVQPSESSDRSVTKVTLGELFDTTRVKGSLNIFKVVFYFPVALILLVVRLTSCIFGYLLLSFLPKTSQKRSSILKGLSKVLGLMVEVDDKYTDESVKLLVANHVSLLDRLAVNYMVPCLTISKDFQVKNIDCSSFWKDVDFRFPKDFNENEICDLQKCIEESPIRVLQFPECATTNGKIGLLKFHPGVFSLNIAVQPVLIHVSLSSFMTASPSVLKSTLWSDGLWHFISPSTFFKLKTLPSMMKLPEESVSEFSMRVQESMAFAMNITPTAYTSSDKAELLKKTISSADVASPTAEIKPRLSLSKEQSTNSKKVRHLTCVASHKLSLNTAAENFGKTPRERMESYQERKALLIQAARQKYLEKMNC